MELVIGWPQGIYLAILLLSLGIIAGKHGETYRANFWVSGATTLLILGLLTWGGFFG